MIKTQISWKVKGVLQVYDRFSLRPVLLSSLRIILPEGLSVIKKPEGILVFAENQTRKTDAPDKIRLESPVFLPAELTLSREEPFSPVCVWMYPSSRYPAPAQSSKLYGKAYPGTEVFFVFEQESSIKLLSEAKKSSGFLEIYHPGRKSLEGYLLELEAEGRRERILLKKYQKNEKPETGFYEIEGELCSEPYPRLETAVRPVFFTRADNEGNYTLFFRDVPQNASGRVCLVYGSRNQEKEVNIRRGGSVRLDAENGEEGELWHLPSAEVLR